MDGPFDFVATTNQHSAFIAQMMTRLPVAPNILNKQLKIENEGDPAQLMYVFSER